MNKLHNNKVFNISLKEAIINNNLQALEILLKNAGLNLTNYYNNGTLLHEIVELGSPELTKYLIKAGLDIEAEDLRKSTPLMRASRNDNPETRTEIVKILLEAGANVNAADEDKPVLHHFLDNSQRECAKLLIEKGADVNSGENRLGLTMLHKSALRRNNANILFLLEHNADPSINSKSNQSILQYALQGLGMPTNHDYVPNFEVLKKLLEYGANPNAKINRGNTSVFHKILQNGDEKVVRLFIKHGAKYGSTKTGKEIRKQALKNKDKNIYRLIVQLQAGEKPSGIFSESSVAIFEGTEKENDTHKSITSLAKKNLNEN